MKNSERSGPIISSIGISVSAWLQVIVAAVILALGTNISSGYLLSRWEEHPKSVVILFIGLALIVFGCLWLLLPIWKMRSQQRDIFSLILYDRSTNIPVTVPRYQFYQHLAMVLRAALVENKAFSEHWVKEPLTNLTKTNENQSLRILREAVEVAVLIGLSFHLRNCFGGGELPEDRFEALTGPRLAALTSTNRILKLMMTPLDERKPFLDSLQPGLTHDSMLEGERGEMAYGFPIMLPKESAIGRDQSGAISIDTPHLLVRLSIELRHVEDGKYELPEGFLQHYLHCDENSLGVFQVHVTYKVSIRPRYLFTRRSQEWVDSFLYRLEDNFSWKEFLSKIDWESTLTMIDYVDSVRSEATKTVDEDHEIH